MSDEKEMVDNIKKENFEAIAEDGNLLSTPEEPRGDEAHPGEVMTQETDTTVSAVKEEPLETAIDDQETAEIKTEPEASETDYKFENRAVKRRASEAFSDTDADDFKGFNEAKLDDSTVEYQRVLERMEAEVVAASQNFTPVRLVSAPVAPVKRLRQDTDSSRPSSALSSRSEDGIATTDASAASSPANRNRRPTTEMSSPMYRIPLERGWKRELVFRATLDAYSRKNADIYYYTPNGKKLRSSREVSEHLSGTGLTLDNFSFFKEPLGVDDPEKEIIRDAKVMGGRAPAAAPAVPEGKRTPKPKPPKGASPEPDTPKSPPAKIRVKSLGSRLSQSGPPAARGKKPPPAQPAPAPAQPPDNNNSAAWKKPKGQPSRPADLAAVALSDVETSPPPRASLQPCSMACGQGAVPSLACAACLCLYHPACVGGERGATFYCQNCRGSSPPPPSEPPPLTHKSGVTVRRPSHPPQKRVLLRMKVAGGGPDGERVWAVAAPPAAPPAPPPAHPAPPPTAPAPAPAPAPPLTAQQLARASLPQSIAILNGRRFIVVPRAIVQPAQKSAVTNGTDSVLDSPRRRTRGKPELPASVDYFASFYERAKEKNYNVVIQIFQYLGMRDLAHCALVCKLWRQLASTPQLWRHVRMKNSHVSDWGGLCSALKRHGTKRLDLRKMLLPQNDIVFWEQFAQHIPSVESLERIELCRCPSSAVEAVCQVAGLRCLAAVAIRDPVLDPGPLANLCELLELRLKSMSGLSLSRDLNPLASLKKLRHLSLTSIKDLGCCVCEVVGELQQLESLELGECTFGAQFAGAISRLRCLRRLRLERGVAHCAAPALLRALPALPLLTRLELVNVDVKVGFDDALAECKNIQRLLIIPTYVSQSATTNKQVLSGVLRLKDTLTHLMWGVTIELLRVTELFIDQCSQPGGARRELGECIPVLKPVPGAKLSEPSHHVNGPPQVEILPLPTLQRLLSSQLPNTKLKLLRIPFHATWRQSLADFH